MVISVAGVYCASARHAALKERRDDEAFVGYEVPKSKAVDIDNDDDWLFAEAIYRGMHLNNLE